MTGNTAAGGTSIYASAVASQGIKLSKTTSAANPTFEPCGLRNIGNTCFMNSILQPVIATTLLTDYFMSTFQKENHPRKTPIAQTFRNFVKEYIDANGMSITPSGIKNAVSRSAP